MDPNDPRLAEVPPGQDRRLADGPAQADPAAEAPDSQVLYALQELLTATREHTALLREIRDRLTPPAGGVRAS